MREHANTIGMHYLDLETPALLVDIAAMERNLQRMASFFAAAPANLRPHAKTHRAPALARRQIAAGAEGICCGSLPEAEVMLDAGIDDVLITKQVVLPSQIRRMVELAGRHEARVITIVDDETIVARINAAAQAGGVQVGVLVDVDLRLGRSGVSPFEPARRLAHRVAAAAGLMYLGLMGYEGSMHQLDDADRELECRRALRMLSETKDIIERDGIAVAIVSCGATSTYRTAAAHPGVTEVQAGSYLLGDGKYRRLLPEFECALTVLATVVSRPGPMRATIDAGQKKLSSDGGLPQPKRETLRTVALQEEHGLLDVNAQDATIRVGDRIELIPWHGGTTINLYDRIYGIRAGRVVEIWDIAARGA